MRSACTAASRTSRRKRRSPIQLFLARCSGIAGRANGVAITPRRLNAPVAAGNEPSFSLSFEGSSIEPKACKSATSNEVTKVAEEPSPVLAISPRRSVRGGSMGGSDRSDAALIGRLRAFNSSACE